jgi:hypothetical protein
MADDFFISYGDLIRDDNTFSDLDKNIDKLEKRLKTLAKAQKKAFENVKPDDTNQIEKLEKSVVELTQAQKNLTEQKKAANKVKKQTIQLTNEELVQRESEKLAQRERVQRAKQEAIILKAEKNNIASLRAQLSLATLEWKKYTAEEIKSTKEGKKAFDDKKRLTEQLKKLEKATGDHRREVGNYANSLNRLNGVSKKVRKTLIGLFVGRNIISGIQRIGGAFKSLVDDFRDSDSAIGGIGKSFDKVTSSLQFTGVKILTAFAPIIEKIANFISTLPATFAGISAAASQLTTNIGSSFKKLGLSLELIFARLEASNPFSDKNAQQIEANIARIESAIQSQTDRQGSLADAYNEAYNAVTKEQEAFIAKQQAADDKAARDKARKIKEDIDKQTRIELELRLKAIVQIQKALEQARTEGIEDSEDRLLALEELRFKNEQALRIAQFNQFKEDNKDFAEEVATFKKATDALAEQQELDHQRNLVNIRKDFAIQTNDIATIKLDDGTKAQEALLNEEVKLVEDANQRKTDSNDELLKNIQESANKVSQTIVDLYQKQADLAAQRVTDQETNLSKAEERAAKGLKTNLAFEKKALAERQAEQKRAAETAKNLAKAAVLINLVSAYAAGGDSQALFNGLRDFALLEAAQAALGGFEEGGYTGDNGKSDISGVVHGQEFVLTAEQTKAYGLKGKSANEFGSAMGDYFNPQTPLSMNPYKSQQEAFEKSVTVKHNNDMLNELKGIKKQLSAQPNYSAQIVEVQKGLYEWVLREQKQNSAKIKKDILRAMK